VLLPDLMMELNLMRFCLLALLLTAGVSKPESRMCEPAYDFCLGKDRVGMSSAAWAKLLFRAVSPDDILCIGAFCVKSWLVAGSYSGECCQAMTTLNDAVRSTAAEALGT